MAADGSIIFDTKLDTKGLDKGFSAAEVKAKKAADAVTRQTKVVADLEAKLAKAQNGGASDGRSASMKALEAEQAPLIAQAEKLAAELAAAKAKAAEFGDAWRNGVVGADREQTMWNSRVAELTAQYNTTLAAIEKIDVKMASAAAKSGATPMDDTAGIAALSQKIDTAKIKLDELIVKEREAGVALRQSMVPGAGAVEAVAQSFGKLSARIGSTLQRALVFSVLYKGINAFKSYLGSALQSNADFAASLAQVKGALLTAFQPIFSAIIPALVTLLNILAAVISAIASFFALLSGKGLKATTDSAKAMHDQAGATAGAGGAAEKASKQIADFDEINKLEDNSGGGGGGGGGGGIAPDFSAIEEASEKFELIRDLVIAIGLGLLAWKIASAFTNDLNKLAGIAMLVAGAFLFIKGYWDAWENGVDTTNLIEMFLGLALVVGGLALLFGPVVAGIAAIVGGIAMMVLGFRDIVKNGANLQNTLLVLGGILAAGLGISLVTGSWFPMLIAGILAVILAVVAWAGKMDELVAAIQTILEGFMMFFTGVFSGDWEMAVEGLKMMWEGFRDAIIIILDSLQLGFNTAMDAIVEKFGLAGTDIETIIEGLKQIFGGIIDFLTGVFNGDWEAAWNGLVEIFKGIINGVGGIFAAIINLIIDGLNWLIGKLNSVSFELPDWLPGGLAGKTFGINIPTIDHIAIPQLAQGAVIPPNSEFLAMLGDQKRGVNIETPLETMLAAFRQVMAEGGGGRDLTVILELDRIAFGKVVARINDEETQRIGMRLGGVRV